jgi:RimJ/RimL family protein N-acetyltransferase
MSDAAERAHAVFAGLKALATPQAAAAAALVLSDGALVPVCAAHAADAALIATCAAWREATSFAFPTQFPVTLEGTGRWLTQRILGAPDRMLFLVQDAAGELVGHIGCAVADADGIEIENVVRGVDGAGPGLMSQAMVALTAWIESALGASTIVLKVFEDNDHAVRFYRRLGYVEAGREPLRRHVDGPAVAFKPLAPDDQAPPDRCFLCLRHDS